MTSFENDIRHLTESAGQVRLEPWTLLRIAGSDRHTFLHNFCTASIKGLSPGQVTEAFVLNDKGKTLGHVGVWALADSLWLSGPNDQQTTLCEHLERFIIREDVRLISESAQRACFFIGGKGAAARLEAMGLQVPTPNQVVETSVDGLSPIVLAHTEIAGWGYLALVPIGQQSAWVDRWAENEIVACSEAALHAVRIKHQTPWFGIDLDANNLPQELGRDDRAISFNKGCYLGQETVARIDAIGHVNRRLVGLAFGADCFAEAGGELFVEGKRVGVITSATRWPAGPSALGLGYVHRAHCAPGSTLETEDGTVKVIGP